VPYAATGQPKEHDRRNYSSHLRTIRANRSTRNVSAAGSLAPLVVWRKIAPRATSAMKQSKNLYDGVKPDEIEQAMIFSARSRIEREPDYTFVAARLLLRKIYREALPSFNTATGLAAQHRDHFQTTSRAELKSVRLSSNS